MLHLIIRTPKLRSFWVLLHFSCPPPPQPSRWRKQSFIYTHSSSVFRLTNPSGVCAHRAWEEFAPHSSLFTPAQPRCPSRPSRVAAASDMHHALIFGLVLLQLPGVSPAVPGANETDSPRSALCAGTCGRLCASRCPADDDLDPANCSACCLDEG